MDQDLLNSPCTEPLCFACGDGSVSPSPLQGAVGCCAVELCCGQCAADGGNDGFGGYKAHGCGLLVKRASSAHPSPCLLDVVVGC